MKTKIVTIGDVELRYLDGSLDEVVFCKNGECLFHMEYMDTGHVWFHVGEVHVDLVSEQPIEASARLDSGPGDPGVDAEESSEL